MRQRLIAAASLTAIASLALAGCGGSSKSGGSGGGGGKSAATAQSAADLGGMDALIAAAKKEGALNVIALPRAWAGYGAIIDGFTTKYGSRSQREPGRIQRRRDQRAEVDQGPGQRAGRRRHRQRLRAAARRDLFAPYKVATWADIPDGLKDPGGLWYSDYGGYISIGCNAAKVGGTARRRSRTWTTRSTRARSPSTVTRPAPTPRSSPSGRPPWPTAARPTTSSPASTSSRS